MQQQLQAGTADLEWDTWCRPRTSRSSGGQGPASRHLPEPGTNPYLVFNLQSPNNGRAGEREGAAGDRVRDRQDGHRPDLRRPDLNTPLDQVIPPGNVGYQPFDLYPTRAPR